MGLRNRRVRLQGVPMRKFFYGLGVITAIAIVAGGIGLFMLARNGAALDAASKAYVEDTVVTVAAKWDADEFWKRASPHLRANVTRNDMHGLFDTARQALGPLLEYRGSQGQALMSTMNAQTTISAKYVASAHFQNGDADIQFVLVKQGDAWLIEGFHINSSALMQKLVGTRS
jgi:transposase